MSASVREFSSFALLFALIFSVSLIQAQENTPPEAMVSTADTFEKPYKLAAYPSLIYTPETSFDMGVTLVLLWHAKLNGGISRLNEIIVFPFYTLKKQYGISTRHVVVTKEEKWFFSGRNRFQHFPLLYYGPGRRSDPSRASILTADYLISQNRFLKRIAPNTFAGLQTNVQWLSNVTMESVNNGPVMPMPAGGEGNLTVGLGLAAVYDSRTNILNEREGKLLELGFHSYRPAWGSEYRFSTLSWDMRQYLEGFKPNQVFAWQLFGQLTQGTPPFNQLAAVGGESLLRGYYFGRFRDRQFVAAQAEMRWLPFSFSKRVGATAFFSTGLISDKVSQLISDRPVTAGGVGLRYLLFPKKDIYARLDLGVTPEGTGFYIYLGEAF